MNIGIVGVGTVGGALRDVLPKGHNIILYDPPKKMEGDLSSCKVIFVCVPTKNKALIHLENALDYIDSVNKDGLIAIKSTVPPGTTQKMRQKYNRRFVFVPEFLREWSSIKDAQEPDKLVVGYEKEQELDLILQVFEDYIPLTKLLPMPILDAEMAKIALNTLALIKVAYANDLLDICRVWGVNYSNLLNVFAADKNINQRHLNPLHGSYRGAGGKCLPKDTKFMLNAAWDKDLSPQVIKTAFFYNCRLLAKKTGENHENNSLPASIYMASRERL